MQWCTGISGSIVVAVTGRTSATLYSAFTSRSVWSYHNILPQLPPDLILMSKRKFVINR